ncbi:MAG: DUF881 domain-containing protein [Clostridia bacterium]|nr:DUF881 domain-containing protein [Clostridia bacterium]
MAKKSEKTSTEKSTKTTKVTKKIDVTSIEPIDKDAKKEEVVQTKSQEKVRIDAKKIRTYILLGIAAFAFTLIISAQLNTVSNTDIIAEGMREAELLSELAKYKEQLENLQEDYEDSKEIVEEYKSNASTNDALIASMTAELNAASALAGLVNLKGEGVVITLYDSTTTASDLSIEAGLVHDTDLVAMVTELKAAGAEAISINGQRIIATTPIRCVGPTIQINSVKVAAPYYIKAIGNAQYLESALNIRGGIVSSLRSYGITIEVTRQSDIEIEKYDGSYKLRVAQVVK